MAIRFRCRECRRLLSIASRKAGTDIECPICKAPQVVPDEETARAALSEADRPSEADPGADSGREEADGLIVLEEAAAQTSTELPLVAPSAGASSAAPPPVPPAGPSDLVVFERRTIYVQGVLFVLTGVFALLFGVAIGRVSTYVAPMGSGASVGSGEEPTKIFVEGNLVYDPGDGKLTGDEDAVAIFLPEGRQPPKPISISGLRPQDPAPQESHPGIRAIESLGGVYSRADATGVFHVIVPRPGKYRLLLISRHANRPEDSLVDEVDREEIGKYFSRPEDLIGRAKYRWTTEDARPGSPPVRYSFGSDGK